MLDFESGQDVIRTEDMKHSSIDHLESLIFDNPDLCDYDYLLQNDKTYIESITSTHEDFTDE